MNSLDPKTDYLTWDCPGCGNLMFPHELPCPRCGHCRECCRCWAGATLALLLLMVMGGVALIGFHASWGR